MSIYLKLLKWKFKKLIQSLVCLRFKDILLLQDVLLICAEIIMVLFSYFSFVFHVHLVHTLHNKF